MHEIITNTEVSRYGELGHHSRNPVTVIILPGTDSLLHKMETFLSVKVIKLRPVIKILRKI